MFHRVFDRDGNGFITRDELQTAMEMIGEPLSETQLTQLLAIADLDQDGRINYEGRSIKHTKNAIPKTEFHLYMCVKRNILQEKLHAVILQCINLSTTKVDYDAHCYNTNTLKQTCSYAENSSKIHKVT